MRLIGGYYVVLACVPCSRQGQQASQPQRQAPAQPDRQPAQRLTCAAAIMSSTAVPMMAMSGQSYHSRLAESGNALYRLHAAACSGG